MSILDTFYRKLKVLNECPSEVTFNCPVCKGKIKASKSQIGKYLCVSSGCESSSIRKKLNLSCGRYQSRRRSPYPELKNMTHYTSSSNIIGVDLIEYIKHRPFWVDIKENSVISYYRLGCYRLTKNKDAVVSNVDYVYRTDFINKRFGEEKKIFQNFINKNPPLFNQEFLQKKRGTVVWLEGEKSAFYFTISTGLLGLSFGASTESEPNIKCYLEQIKRNVDSILYFPDNDKTGLEKANKFKNIASENGIGVKILNPYSVRDDFDKGDDVIEFLLNEGNYKLFNLIMEDL